MTALSIAALLKVDLHPWQEVVLQRMLRMHREVTDAPPAVVEVVKEMPRDPWPGICGEQHPTEPTWRCGRARGHDGHHEAPVPGLGASSRWIGPQGGCPARLGSPHGAEAPCVWIQGHPGNHRTPAGREWPNLVT